MDDGLTLFERMVFAIKRDDSAEITRLLRASRSLLNSSDSNNDAPLHYAASCGSLKAIETLLQWGADINVLNPQGRTPLCIAAVELEVPAIELLLKKGADLNACDRDGHNTLPYAVTDPGILSMLIGAGLRLDCKSEDSLTLPDWHYKMAHKETALFFIDALKLDVNEQDGLGVTILHSAAQSGDMDFVKKLVGRGARLDLQDAKGRTPLALAVEHPATFRFLFETASPSKDAAGDFLLRAVALGNAEIADFLLKSGAVLSAVNERGQTPLELAREQGKTAIEGLLTREEQKRSFERNIRAADALIPRPNRPRP